uniref:Uncharacterized protein n=1 Tax=Rhizophora mucronata TaxID=61149 RepID=A0A2P2N9M7_RHIMU
MQHHYQVNNIQALDATIPALIHKSRQDSASL